MNHVCLQIPWMTSKMETVKQNYGEPEYNLAQAEEFREIGWKPYVQRI